MCFLIEFPWTAIFEFFSWQIADLHVFWDQLVEDYDPWVVPCFLEILHCYLHIWSSGLLLQALQTTSRREIPSINTLGDSEALSDPCFLLPLVADFLNLYAFSWFDGLVFPKMVLKPKFVFSPWPAGSGWFEHMVTSHLPKLLSPPPGTPTGNWPQGVCGGVHGWDAE